MDRAQNVIEDNPSSRRTLCYHEFSRTASTDVYQMTPAMFGDHLAAGVRAAQRTSTELEITFDDAHGSQLEFAAPMLENVGLRGLFFVPASWISVRPETANWSALNALLAAGHRVGSHGNTHALLTQCSASALVDELQKSRDILQQKLGVQVDTISAPGGRWNLQVVEACAQAGYRSLYTSEPSGTLPLTFIDRSIDIKGRLVLRRTMSAKTVARYIGQERILTARLRLEYKLKHGIKQVLGDNAYQVLWRMLLRSPVA